MSAAPSANFKHHKNTLHLQRIPIKHLTNNQNSNKTGSGKNRATQSGCLSRSHRASKTLRTERSAHTHTHTNNTHTQHTHTKTHTHTHNTHKHTLHTYPNIDICRGGRVLEEHETDARATRICGQGKCKSRCRSAIAAVVVDTAGVDDIPAVGICRVGHVHLTSARCREDAAAR